MADPRTEAGWLTHHVGVRRLDVAVVWVRDTDARSWLNGQITNDVSRLAPGEAVYSLAVDVRGKILSDMWVVARGAELGLIVPSEARDPLLEHFDRYIVMEDVELEPAEELAVITVQGPASLPLEGELFPCDRLGRGGHDVLVAKATADELEARLVERARDAGGGAVGAAGWDLARLQLGVPAFGADFGPATLPQEAGLKDRAVSFEKGCYLGQEVVCMLENRGKLRRMLVQLEGPTRVEVGAVLARDDAEVGAITSVAEDGELVRAMALIRRVAAEPGTVLRSGNAELVVTRQVGAGH